ncbi:hypothetical protein D3C84_1096300 [compost metagenome]
MINPMLSPGCGSKRCGEYGGAALRSGSGVKRRLGQVGMVKLQSSSMRFQFSPPFQWVSMVNSGKPVLRSSWTMSVHQT